MPNTVLSLELQAVSMIKKAFTWKSGRAINMYRGKWERAMEAFGFDASMVYYLWHQCREMAELEALCEGVAFYGARG